MGKNEFATVALDPEHMIYIVYAESVSSVASSNSSPLEFDVHPSRRPQISGLIAKEALTKIPNKYINFAIVFFPNLASKLHEHTEINNYAIKLVDNQQLPYESIYSLGPVELETLKAYIETNLANKFIRPSKSLASAIILFDWKSNHSLQLCVNYWGLNNFTIKNRYSLSIIKKLLDRLRKASRFTQLDLTSAYYWIRIQKENKWKTTLKTWYGHFEYQIMLFGLTNAPVSFQKYFNKIFTKKLDIIVIVYLEDILIYINDDGDGHIVGFGTTQEVLAICQPEEVLVLLGKDSVPRLCNILRKHPHRGQKNWKS